MPYRQAPGLRLRPVPELGTCLAFTPHPPRLHTLNPAAWLIAELCALPGEALEAEFVQRTQPLLSQADARSQFRDGVRRLLETGIIMEEERGE